MLKPKFSRVIFFLIYSLILLGIGYLTAVLISKRLNAGLQDVMFYVGLVIIVIGALSSIGRVPSSKPLHGFGQHNS